MSSLLAISDSYLLFLIEWILISEKENRIKYKMQFLNNDLNSWKGILPL